MKAVITYVLVSLALALGLNTYVTFHPLYRGKTTRIDRLYDRLNAQDDTGCPAEAKRTLVLGNSYVDHSFLPGEDCRFVKFTVSGMPLRDAARIVTNLQPEQHIERVVVGIGYNDANPVESDSSVYMRYWASSPLHRALWAMPLVRGRGMTLTLIKEDVKCLYSSRPCARTQTKTDDAGVGPEGEIQNDAQFASSVRRRYAEYRPFVRSVSGQLRGEIESIAAACNERGIPLLVYTAPIAPPLQQQLDPEFVAAFHRQIRAAGVDYVDFNERYGSWGSAYFSDATHVNDAGGHIITTQLMTLIGLEREATAHQDPYAKPGS